jgi:hypothetical protein
MLINYREQRVAPLVAFLLFVPGCLIVLPLWAGRHFGAPHGALAGKLIIAPIFGLFYLFLIARTLSFNARVRRDPRAFGWDSLGLNLWQNGRAERIQWSQVGDIRVQQPARPNYPAFLRIATRKADGRVTRWSFPTTKLQLAGQSIDNIATQIEQARSGGPVMATAAPAVGRPSDERYEKRVASARAIVAVVMSAYFVTLVGLIVYLSSPDTVLLTPHDPLLWLAARIAFFGTSGAILLWYVKTISNISPMSWRIALWFLPKVMVPGLFFGAMMGFWAYLAANAYVTAKTFGGTVHHSAVRMVVEPGASLRGRPTVHAHLINRPGQDVLFTVAEGDEQVLQHWHDPGYIDEPACITVPVQWSGYAIRAELRWGAPLPAGSVTACW